MATVKKGLLTESPQWWKHLRDWKRVFWKRERKAAQRDSVVHYIDDVVQATRSSGCVFCDIGLVPVRGWHTSGHGEYSIKCELS